jgi:hypothetical protein
VGELVATVSQYDNGLQIALQHDDLYHAFKQPVPDEELTLGDSGGRRSRTFVWPAGRQRPK